MHDDHLNETKSHICSVSGNLISIDINLILEHTQWGTAGVDHHPHTRQSETGTVTT